MEDNEFEILKNNDKYLVERQRPNIYKSYIFWFCKRKNN